MQDIKILELLNQELERQRTTLDLIPSENIVSRNVLLALGSVLTNKYAEGYPSKRYYAGNQFVDEVEALCRERAKSLFKAEHANVQPYSGSPANAAVYFALLNHGDKAMGMALAHGGHLTHGHKVTFSGKNYQFTQYGLNKDTFLLDYDEIEMLAKQENPKIIVSGHSAYPRIIDFKRINEIAASVGAISMADISHISGLIVADVHPSPLPFTDIVTTTTHKTLRGPRGALILCKEEFREAIDKAVFPGLQGGPHENAIASIAVALFEAQQTEFKEYAHQIVKNAKALASSLMEHGIKLITDGTDNHLMLLDVRTINITGKDAEAALEKADIICNKNAIPFDPNPPANPSGLRIGTPSITTRGMKESEMKLLGEMIVKVLKNHTNSEVINKVKQEVQELCKQFPIYKDERYNN